MVRIFHASVTNNFSFLRFLVFNQEPRAARCCLWTTSKAPSNTLKSCQHQSSLLGHPRTGQKMHMQECIRSFDQCVAFWKAGWPSEGWVLHSEIKFHFIAPYGYTWMLNAPPVQTWCLLLQGTDLYPTAPAIEQKNLGDVWKYLQRRQIFRLAWAGFEISSTESTNCHLMLNSITLKNCSA